MGRRWNCHYQRQYNTKNSVTAPSNAYGGGIWSNGTNTITNNEAQGGGNTNTVLVNAIPAFNGNCFIDNKTKFDIYYNMPVGSANLNALNNWWGTTNEMGIITRIYDFFIDASKAIVDYYPYLKNLRKIGIFLLLCR